MGLSLCARNRAITLLLGVLNIAAVATAAEMKPLWQIGKADGKAAEFALAPKGYASYSGDPVFLIGRSEPNRDWPYCHPGPSDVWAGPRPHAFTIAFNIDEIAAEVSGNVVLRLIFADTHSQSPPRLEIGLNGDMRTYQTVKGKSDDSITQGKPGRVSEARIEWPVDRLVKGGNRIVIGNVAASWLLYDAVAFLAPEGVRLGKAPEFYRIEQARDTILRRRGSDGQSIRVEILAAADKPRTVLLGGIITGVTGQDVHTQTQAVVPGRQWVDFDIPRLSGWPADVTLWLEVDGERVSTETVTAHPHRDWTIYLANHSHVDIGYTEVQTKILEDQKKFILESMDFVEQHPEFTGDAQFCWNAEVLWAVKDFLRNADKKTRDRFFRHVRQGSIGLQALYGNELTGLCSPEEMVRLVGYAGDLAREEGVTIDTAMITDVPGWSWGTIAALAGAGVKYFDVSPNANARLCSLRRVWEEKPFYWEAPDGKGRVLTWMATPGYYRMYGLLQKPQDVENMLWYVRELEKRADYPYDVTHIRMCAGDNGAPELRLSAFVKEWNEKWESPRLVIGRSRDAFVDLEKRWGDKIPTYRGDLAPYWEDGAGSSADETARTRRAVKALTAAEKIWSVAGANPPVADLERAWDNALLYDEHTWGAHNSISDPDSDFAKRQWKIKGQFARDAETQAEELVEGGLRALAAKVSCGEAPKEAQVVLVFNPCSWPRTDVVHFQYKSDKSFGVVDSDENSAAVVSLDGGRKFSFIARDVPPIGYKTFRIGDAVHAQTQVRVDEKNGEMRGPYFDVDINPTSASIARLAAPRRGLRPERLISTGGLNRYLYNTNGKPEETAACKDAVIEPALPDTPDGAAVVLRSKAPGCNSLEQKIELHSELPWIDITNTVDRGDVRTPEGLYFDFPFDGLKNAKIRYQTAWTPVQIDKDLLPGSCLNYFCVQNYVEVRGRKQTLVFAPIDAPLIEIGEVHANTRRHLLPEYDSVKTDPPRVLSYVMNNYWFTNYRAHQPGKVSFHYRLYRYAGNDPVKTERFGIEAREPMRAIVVSADEMKGPLAAGSRSFAQVKPDNVIITDMKPASDGGLLVRVQEIAGKKARARLSLDGVRGKAMLVDLWERPKGPAMITGGSVRLALGPREIKTVHIGKE